MQTNNGVDVEMERLSRRLDQMESWEIARFVLVTTARLFSIFSCYAVTEFIVKHRPIRNRANTLVVNLCLVICANYVYATVYQFLKWKNGILPEAILEILTFSYYIFYISLIAAISTLPCFWFLFLTFKNLFQKLDFLILLGLCPPYLIPSIFTFLLWNFHKLDINKLYYYFVLYYSFNLFLVLAIYTHFLMLKLEERLQKNKLDYLLHLGVCFLISLFPEILCLTFELYFFDERGPLYYKVYYIDFGVDLFKYLCPVVLFSWLVVSNKYFRKACKKTFSRKRFIHIFRVERKNEGNDDENYGDVDVTLNLNEVFL